MTTSESINEIATALAKAQSEMSGAIKDSVNPFFAKGSSGGRYADLAAVRAAAIGPLTRHGIAVIQSPSADGPTVTVSTLLVHTSGQWIRGEMSATAKDETPQALISIVTYLRRTTLAAFASVAPVGEDDDAEAAQGRGNGQSKPVLVPQTPPGFSDWLTGFSTSAESGLESMRTFWRESPQTMRDFLMQSAPNTVEKLKERATFVDASKTPMTPELATQEAAATMKPRRTSHA